MPLASFVLRGLSDFDLSDCRTTIHRFHVGKASLEGTLVLPTGSSDVPIAVLVHGDGPQTRWSDDGHLPLVNALLDDGIGVFSWDKPGTGSSGGNWLDQSMHDRAVEAIAVVAYLRGLPDLSPDRIGFLGFSQAGWVVPQASDTAYAAFTILVGPAVNWRLQGAYYTRRLLEALGTPYDRIAAMVGENLTRNDLIFGSSGGSTTDSAQSRPDMEPARFAFARRNYDADATSELAAFRGPMLAIWGGDDTNVDPVESADVFARTLSGGAGSEVIVLPDTNHGLLRAGWFDYQLSEDWPWPAKALFIALGRRAFAPEAIPLLTG